MLRDHPTIERMERYGVMSQPKVICECAGCQEEIYEGDDVLEFDDVTGETVLVHQESSCAYEYVSAMATCKVAG